jgi:hypothetical protein
MTDFDPEEDLVVFDISSEEYDAEDITVVFGGVDDDGVYTTSAMENGVAIASVQTTTELSPENVVLQYG